MQVEIQIHELRGEPEDMAEFQRVLEGAPDYFERVMGGPPGPAEAQSDYTLLPEGKSYADKFVYGIFRKGEMVGCADVIRGYPTGDTAFIGLLLIAEANQRQGIGQAAYRQIEEQCRSWPGIQRIRLGVVETNTMVIPFWEKMGFRRTGETRPYRYGPVHSTAVVFEKSLSRH
jgi:RimJ/RimL family protein N-acetyltransferase